MRSLLFCLSFSVLACKTEPTVIPDSTTDSTIGDAASDVLDTTEADTGTDTTEADTGTDTTEADTEDTNAPSDVEDTEDTNAPSDVEDTEDTTAPSDVEDTEDTADTSGDTDAPACTTADDCQNCTWGHAVQSEADCYCPLCPTFPLSREQCEANQTAWNTHCTTWAETNPCPIPRCLMVAPPICTDAGECAADPNSCVSASDCTMCRFAEPPKSAADCACPMCPTPTSATHCEAVAEAVLEHCGDFDFDSCLEPPCVRPPKLTCTFTGICGYDEPEL